MFLGTSTARSHDTCHLMLGMSQGKGRGSHMSRRSGSPVVYQDAIVCHKTGWMVPMLATCTRDHRMGNPILDTSYGEQL